jgi:FixJ family two-component response regulator
MPARRRQATFARMARHEGSVVYIVDDDASLRRSLRNLLSSVGFRVEMFESAEAFLQADPRLSTGCLVLDLRMPGMGGLALLSHLQATRSPHPVIILTGHGNDEARQQSLRAGAIAFLEKPFASGDLLAAIERAMSMAGLSVAAEGAGGNAATVRDRSIQFAGGTLDKHRHICAFFNGADEEHRVLRSFVKDGIDAGERAFHIVGPEEKDEHLQWLRDEGIDVEQAMSTGQLQVLPWHESYLRGDRFEQDAMLALADEVLRSNEVAGYPLTRIVAHMEWALLDKPGVDDLVEYEARANFVLPRYASPVICTYDLSKFSASVVMDVLRTHPMVIVGGVLQENPFFVPPDQFLLEIRERSSERKNARVAS